VSIGKDCGQAAQSSAYKASNDCRYLITAHNDSRALGSDRHATRTRKLVSAIACQ
jgi:hypothetical protein